MKQLLLYIQTNHHFALIIYYLIVFVQLVLFLLQFLVPNNFQIEAVLIYHCFKAIFRVFGRICLYFGFQVLAIENGGILMFTMLINFKRDY